MLHKSIKNKNYDIVPIVKNRNLRRKYGLNILEIEDFLFSITKEDLINGPVRDMDMPDEN